MFIRKFTKSDLNAVLKVEQAVWGNEAATEDQILSRAEICPEGSLVAQYLNGKIVGYAAAQRVSSLSTATWDLATDFGTLAATHRPNGPIAFGVGMAVLPEAARFNVSGVIIQTFSKVFVRDSGCHLMALGSRVPGFHRWKQQNDGTIHTYLDQQRKGFSIDPEICLYQKSGFSLMWPVKNYFSDSSSLDWGAIISMNRQTAISLTT